MILEPSRRWALLPGWGMSPASLRPLADALHPDPVTVVQWPTESSVWREALRERFLPLRESLTEQVDAPALWVGWSLGGLVLGRLLQEKTQPFPACAAAFLGCGPRFVRTAGSPWGVPRAELRAFSLSFRREPERAWQRFLRWQCSGEPNPDECARVLLASPCGPSLYSLEVLHAGLTLLERIDWAPELDAPSIPLLFVRGARDPLCPEGRELASRFSRGFVEGRVLEQAGHVPQLSQPDGLAKILREWRGDLGS